MVDEFVMIELPSGTDMDLYPVDRLITSHGARDYEVPDYHAVVLAVSHNVIESGLFGVFKLDLEDLAVGVPRANGPEKSDCRCKARDLP